MQTTSDTIDQLRKELDEVTMERKAAAERARYLRHAIGNLEAAQARSYAPALTEDLPDGEGVVATTTDWR